MIGVERVESAVGDVVDLVRSTARATAVEAVAQLLAATLFLLSVVVKSEYDPSQILVLVAVISWFVGGLVKLKPLWDGIAVAKDVRAAKASAQRVVGLARLLTGRSSSGTANTATHHPSTTVTYAPMHRVVGTPPQAHSHSSHRCSHSTDAAQRTVRFVL